MSEQVDIDGSAGAPKRALALPRRGVIEAAVAFGNRQFLEALNNAVGLNRQALEIIQAGHLSQRRQVVPKTTDENTWFGERVVLTSWSAHAVYHNHISEDRDGTVTPLQIDNFGTLELGDQLGGTVVTTVPIEHIHVRSTVFEKEGQQVAPYTEISVNPRDTSAPQVGYGATVSVAPDGVVSAIELFREAEAGLDAWKLPAETTQVNAGVVLEQLKTAIDVTAAMSA
jgi:choline dehydrogenase-like flavoprotein